MSYRQPRIPEYREGEAAGGYLRLLTLFLKDFTMAAWAANNRRKKEIAAMKAQIDALSARQETEGR
ncbi:MAG: hypothetical protein IKK34_12970 [Clostridia bacterium]|nr:hypothetical protein [Clostridia bacterium]